MTVILVPLCQMILPFAMQEVLVWYGMAKLQTLQWNLWRVFKSIALIKLHYIWHLEFQL